MKDFLIAFVITYAIILGLTAIYLNTTGGL